MPVQVTPAELERLISLVEDEIARIDVESGSFSHADYLAWRKKSDAAEGEARNRLEQIGAKFTCRPPHDHAVKLAGIRSSSTSGYVGALRNWQRAAKTRIGKS